MTAERLDCLCAGIVVADHVCEPIDRMPRAGELVLTSRLSLTVGGCASNVAVDLARLGVRTGIAGAVGKDLFGEFVRRRLIEAGVDCAALEEHDDVPTAGTLVVNVAGEDRRFVHAVGANAVYDGRGLDARVLRGARVLYLGGYGLDPVLSAEHVARAFRTARESGALTVLDVVVSPQAGRVPDVGPVLPFVDFFLPNTDEGRILCGLADPLEQARAFRTAGARHVAVTCGADGVVLAGPAGCVRAAAYAVPCVDGTGSGDAFAAGVIRGLLDGADPVECLRIGAALGASCVQAIGATTGVFDAERLHTFLAEHPLKSECIAE